MCLCGRYLEKNEYLIFGPSVPNIPTRNLSQQKKQFIVRILGKKIGLASFPPILFMFVFNRNRNPN